MLGSQVGSKTVKTIKGFLVWIQTSKITSTTEGKGKPYHPPSVKFSEVEVLFLWHAVIYINGS